MASRNLLAQFDKVSKTHISKRNSKESWFACLDSKTKKDLGIIKLRYQNGEYPNWSVTDLANWILSNVNVRVKVRTITNWLREPHEETPVETQSRKQRPRKR